LIALVNYLSFSKFRNMLKQNKPGSPTGIPLKGKTRLMEYFPAGINRLYADFQLVFDTTRGYRNIKELFRKKMGYDLNLDTPRSYSEKIIWKKLYDRNPLLTETADKFKVRSYIRKKLGRKDAEKILIPLYFVSSDPDTIPFEEFPENFVIKPNHGSRMHLIVNGNGEENIQGIKKTCEEWLKHDYGLYHYEWAYRDIKRKIIVEKLLRNSDGNLPMDYKLFCFHGKCKCIRVSKNRLNSNGLAIFVDPEWNFLPVTMPGYNFAGNPFEKPSNLSEIIATAEKLSADFDAVRIDLYNSDGKIYFGEITHYHTSGLARFDPVSFDFELGGHWNLSKDYWL
jgi:hypothetical protein